MVQGGGSCLIRCSFHFLNIFLAAILVTVVVYHTTDKSSSLLVYQTTNKINVHSVTKILVDSPSTDRVDSLDKSRAGSSNGSSVDYSSNESRVDSVEKSRVDLLNESRVGSLNGSSVDYSVNKSRVDSVNVSLVDTVEMSRVDSLNESRVDSVNVGRVDPVVSGCDLFSGKWVYDESYPLYKDRECAFMFDDLACEKYGRKDLNYQRWRWQPHGCDLPRFDAKAFLERLRGKRLVFVGDSVNRNQWVSMMCLVESSIPKAFKYMRLKSSLYSFKATEYNASIDFYWAPMLVESNNDNPSNHSNISNRIVRIESIEKHARQWSDADILVFNSYLWWRIPKLKVLHGSFEDPNQVYKEVKMLRCYEMALKTWSKWLDTHVNRTKTRLFFVSMSATHSRAEEWGMPKDQKCYNETEPVWKEGYWGSGSDPKMMSIVDGAISKLKRRGLNIQMLNITQLSEYRKDGHPSIYRKQWRPLSKEQLSDPRNYADCTHWCLPGVPDVWNELLHAYILQD